ncbi:glycerol-3-phosphate acyltransferase [Paenibacillus sp. HJGM_3]|uniref:glycerol-3-phosphate acyltransferase n=1 Tax=Paenibacillus sp. HJGM_3 TaxID=3379816 RepID=UPI00385BEC05
MIVVLTAVAFLSGSLMFSYWLGLWARHNLRLVGDGNPGALNLWKASGYKLGLAGIVLDFGKGYVPVLLVLALGHDYVSGLGIVPVALAPITGHAFSPFLQGKGGKAIAVTFGVWSALTRFEVSLAYAVILAVLLAVSRWIAKGRTTSEADGLQVVGGLLLVGGYVWLRAFPVEIGWVWLGSFLLLSYTHRAELTRWWRRRRNRRLI